MLSLLAVIMVCLRISATETKCAACDMRRAELLSGVRVVGASLVVSNAGDGRRDEGEDEDEDEDEDEELALDFLPENLSELDPEMLAQLPKSMQLEVMGRMRDQRNAENREYFQAAATAPESFSQLQMTTYLKSCDFRKRMDGVIRDSGEGPGTDGLRPHRIAAEADREYVFSKNLPEGNRQELEGADATADGPSIAPLPTGFGLAAGQPAAKAGAQPFFLTAPTHIPSAAGKPAMPALPPASSDRLPESIDLREDRSPTESAPAAAGTIVALPKEGKSADPQFPGTDADIPKRRHWEQRMKKWSRSHGFKLGRKLDDWEDDAGGGGGPLSVDAPVAVGDELDPYNEDLQAALRLSLMPATHVPGAGPQEQVQELPPGVAAHLLTEEPPDVVTLTEETADVVTLTEEAADVVTLTEEAAEHAWNNTPVIVSTTLAEVTMPVHEFLEMVENIAEIWPEYMPDPLDLADDPAIIRCCGVSWELEPPVGKNLEAIAFKVIGKAQQQVAARMAQGVVTASAPAVEDYFLPAPAPTGAAAEDALVIELDLDQENGSEEESMWEEVGAVEDAPEEMGAVEGVAGAATSKAPGQGAPGCAAGKDEDGTAEDVEWEDVEGEDVEWADVEGEVVEWADVDGEDVERADVERAEAPGKDCQEMEQDAPRGHASVPCAAARDSAAGSSGAATEPSGTKRRLCLSGARRFAVESAPASCLPGASGASTDPDTMVLDALEATLSSAAVRANHHGEQPGAELADRLGERLEGELREEAASLENRPLRADKRLATAEEELWLQQTEQWEHDIAAAAQHADREAVMEASRTELLSEHASLQTERRAAMRNADAPSSEMYGECQELLQMFGLPYIIAPQEAEAQCAFLNETNLVDGVITDDSDVFLFGGDKVYKNIFEGNKYVEAYQMSDIASDLGLSRKKLVYMALLLGSDYTEGISGVGIVNAVEIVKAFESLEGLKEFKEWVQSADSALVEKLERAKSKKRASRARVRLQESPDASGDSGGEEGAGKGSARRKEGEPETGDEELDRAAAYREEFKRKHRGAKTSWDLPDTFPSESVVRAYIEPQVDRSKDKFEWARPDLALLRHFCSDKFGWSQEKVDELLLPVLEEYDKRQTQMRMDQFYLAQRFAKIKSSRLQRAVAGITGKHDTELTLPGTGSKGGPSKAKGGKAAGPRRRKRARSEQGAGCGSPGEAPEVGEEQSAHDSAAPSVSRKSDARRTRKKK
ncbi:hypothetical protein CYMTET_44982 [Cymbomonas tetramitiformis]|uniref:XPG-I domain-containing protein n=1 Tax=Cymbomonas tetramitiformis TaxID=36881 RepID=A0AAE0C0V3_9CHLO|nr:hypothetical protein CYMTET_44982 [Cymbomonas tetramitiformis]